MGFFGSDVAAKRAGGKVIPSLDLMHRLQCRICPRQDCTARTPKMEPGGSKEPAIYVLGTQPSEDDDEEGTHYIRDSGAGRVLHAHLPKGVAVRYNYIVRTRDPDDDSMPKPEVIECCRPSVEKDIEATQPLAVFGFGQGPLTWAKPGMRMEDARGRRFPLRVGRFVTWFYSFDDPEDVRKPRPGGGGKPNEQIEFAFRFDMRRAMATLEWGDEPISLTREEALSGIETYTKHHGGVAKIVSMLKRACAIDVTGFDYETQGLRPYREENQILTAGIALPDVAFAFPLHHPGALWTTAEREEIERAFIEYLRSRSRKAVHQLGFEMEWTGHKYGRELLHTGAWEDTLSQAFILDERMGGRKKDGPGSLHFLCRQHFDVGIKDLSPNVNTKDMSSVRLADVLPYNALDAKFHRMLFFSQHKLLKRNGLQQAYELKLEQVPTVVLTQLRGVPIDADAVKKLNDHYQPLLKKADDDIEANPIVTKFRKVAGQIFDPDKDPHIVRLIRDVLQKDYGKPENPKDAWSVDAATLKQIKDPIGAQILARRRYKKVTSTYIDCMLPDSPMNYDGWLHPIFNTTLAVTGRLSAEWPSVQNFPSRDEVLKEVRRQIAARKKKLIAKFDYGQIEARIIAMASKDAAFIKALWERMDIHMKWAEKIAYKYPRRVGGKDGLKDKKVMKKFRGDVKNQWTFPLFFGARLQRVAAELGIPEEVLTPLVDEFWTEFEGVHRYHRRLEKEYNEQGYITYMTGRRRHGPMTRHQLYNSPIQGPATDLMLDGMTRLSRLSVQTGDVHFQPLLQIHDDLTFELPEDNIDEYVERIITEMLDTSAFDFVCVPITIEAEIGLNWCDTESIGDFSSDKWKKAHGN